MTESKIDVRISIDKSFCKGCGICVEMCPTKVFEWSNNPTSKCFQYPIPSRIEACTICRRCELMCPDFAISLEVGGAI